MEKIPTPTDSLSVYIQLANDTDTLLAEMPSAPIATRFHAVMLAKLRQVAPHRATLARIFASALSDEAAPNPLNTPTQLPVLFGAVVRGATDATHKEDETKALVNLLHALYFMVVIFWLYDRTPNYKATALLLDFLREMIKLARPMLIMPLFQRALTHLAGITGMMFDTQ